MPPSELSRKIPSALVKKDRSSIVFLVNTSEHLGEARRKTLKKPKLTESYSGYSMQSTATFVGKQGAIYNFLSSLLLHCDPVQVIAIT
jgi:hypothetical protein